MDPKSTRAELEAAITSVGDVLSSYPGQPAALAALSVLGARLLDDAEATNGGGSMGALAGDLVQGLRLLDDAAKAPTLAGSNAAQAAREKMATYHASKVSDSPLF